MAYAAAHQEPYTKFPNKYNDVIKPQLTDTQRDICDVIIRMTYGWHRTSARISNATFVGKTGKSEQAIINAKKELEKMGLLVVLERGGGSKTGRYMLDLYYDDPDRSVRATSHPQVATLEPVAPSTTPEVTATSDTSSDMSEPSIPEPPEQPEPQPAAVDSPQPHMVVPEFNAEVISQVSPDTEVLPTGVTPGTDVVPEGTCVIPEGTCVIPEGICTDKPVSELEVEVAITVSDAPPHAHDHGQLPPTPQTDIPDSTATAEPVSAEDPEPSTPKLKLAPPSGINSINNKIKQTINTNLTDNGRDRWRDTAAVCSKLRQWGFEIESHNYKFIGWCIKQYGVEAVEHKLQIMRFQSLRGVKFTNPLGWLRVALAGNYQYSQYDCEQLKAKERAGREHERSKRQAAEWEQHRRRVIAEQDDPEVRARVAATQAAFWAMVGEDD